MANRNLERYLVYSIYVGPHPSLSGVVLGMVREMGAYPSWRTRSWYRFIRLQSELLRT